jgi:surfeit locus 1 family protein
MVNEAEALFWRLAPPVAAVLLVIVFVALGLWQLERAAEKISMQQLYEASSAYTPLADNVTVQEYQQLSARGRYLEERQFLIDNMVLNGRLGYFVVTPFEYASDRPLLVVNRGWIAAGPNRGVRPAVPVSSDVTEIRGRVGRLPRVGIRSGDALADDDGEWPKLATYPLLSDLSNALEREVLPFVLLLDPAENETLLRQWQPRTQGPMMHYGYAFQWFAMAAAVLGILIWQTGKRRRRDAI